MEFSSVLNDAIYRDEDVVGDFREEDKMQFSVFKVTLTAF